MNMWNAGFKMIKLWRLRENEGIGSHDSSVLKWRKAAISISLENEYIFCLLKFYGWDGHSIVPTPDALVALWHN